jgi:hypothetical protein
MKKQILAIIAGMTLLTAFIVPSMSNNSFAQVTSESRVLQAILGLTEHLKWHTEELVDTTENIEDDLLFKKKFWQAKNATEAGANATSNDINGSAEVVVLVGVFINSCGNLPEEACAFTVESIQLTNMGEIPALNITFADDNVNIATIGVDIPLTVSVPGDPPGTDISAKGIANPTNLLLDAGIGQIGSSDIVFITKHDAIEGIGEVTVTLRVAEFNGEKPQGVELGFLAVAGAVGSTTAFAFGAAPAISSQSSTSNEAFALSCTNANGEEIECPARILAMFE